MGDEKNHNNEVCVALAGVGSQSREQVLLRAVREAASEVIDFNWLSNGDSILIKPVLNSGNPYPSPTNYEGGKAMVNLLMEKGAVGYHE
jgi:hypothetical protein